MRKLAILVFVAYSALLIKVMVLKDMPAIRIGQLMLNFGGTDGGHPANFVPFATVVPYLFGHKGLIIAGVNLVGNVVLLVPLGLLAPFIYRRMTWKSASVLGVVAGLAIEVLQSMLHVGIFDIDDVILNALGVMIGYWVVRVLTAWMQQRKYAYILIAALISFAAVLGAFYAVYPQEVRTPLIQ